jgi:hypothetical protein
MRLSFDQEIEGRELARELALRIKRARYNHYLDFSYIAQFIGCSKRELYRWLAGTAIPSHPLYKKRLKFYIQYGISILPDQRDRLRDRKSGYIYNYIEGL